MVIVFSSAILKANDFCDPREILSVNKLFDVTPNKADLLEAKKGTLIITIVPIN